MVRALALHQCGRVRFSVTLSCGLSLLLVVVLAPRVFLWVLRFSSLHKNQHLKIPIRPGCQVFTREPLAREIRRLLPHYDVKFDSPFNLPLPFFPSLNGPSSASLPTLNMRFNKNSEYLAQL